MKKAELKKLLKPMIKECIKEVIFGEGILSNIVSEVAQGLGRPTLIEAKKPPFEDNIDREALNESRRVKAQEQRRKLLDAINADAYGGIDLFEGTQPLSSAGSATHNSQAQGPLSGVDPTDAGVDISGIMGLAGNRWSAHMK